MSQNNTDLKIDLAGKVAYVGGASKGIGRAIAIQLAQCGAQLILGARDQDALHRLKDSLPTDKGQKHQIAIVDYKDPDALVNMVQSLAGETAVHIIVNNTGGPKGGPLLDADVEDFEQAYTMHLACNHKLAQAFVPGMKFSGYGRIINIISTSVRIPINGLGVSNTTRGAVASWAKTLSNEIASFGITVNNILPGFIDTTRLEEIIQGRAHSSQTNIETVRQGMISAVPAQRIGKPEEIGYIVAFLASPLGAYINGVSIPVDGGRTGSI